MSTAWHVDVHKGRESGPCGQGWKPWFFVDVINGWPLASVGWTLEVFTVAVGHEITVTQTLSSVTWKPCIGGMLYICGVSGQRGFQEINNCQCVTHKMMPTDGKPEPCCNPVNTFRISVRRGSEAPMVASFRDLNLGLAHPSPGLARPSPTSQWHGTHS